MRYKEYTVRYNTGRLIIVTDIHNCHCVWHGASNEERMELLCESLREEYQKRPYDAIISLGDYSLDYWAFNEGGSCLWDVPVSRTAEFVKKYVPLMPTEFFMIPGNHEQYGMKAWESITGRPREYLIRYGKHTVAMLDTFAGGLDPSENHDGCYTGINTGLLLQALQTGEDVILCAHDICPDKESEAARGAVCNNPCIKCAFAGHTHRDNTVILPKSWREMPVFYCGDFSYSTLCEGRNWGYRRLELSTFAVRTEYVRV